MCVLSHLVISNSLWPHRLYRPWSSPGQNTGVGSLSLIQGIFPTQASDPGLPHCRLILYQLSHKGSPRILASIAYPFSRGSSWPRNWTRVSCTAGIFFTNWAIREAQEMEGKLKFQLHLNVDGTHIRYLWKFLTWRFIKKGLTGFRLLMGLRFSQFKHFFLGWAFSSPPACSIYSHLVSASSISMHFQYALFSFTIHSFLGPLKSGSSDHTLLQ